MGWIWQRKEKQEPVLEPLSDRQYQSLFLSLLEAAPEELQAQLDERQNDRHFMSWLRRFGQELLKNPAENIERAQQMIWLATVDIGQLSTLSKEIGEQLLAQAANPLEKVSPVDELSKNEHAESDSALLVENYKQARLYYQQTAEASLRGDFEKAITACDASLHFKPDNYEAIVDKAVALNNLERYRDAFKTIEQVLAIDSPNAHAFYAHAFYVKGYALTGLNMFEAAITAYDSALTIQPNHHSAYRSKARALYKLSRYEEAIAAYDAALTIQPNDHQVWINRGIASSYSHQYTTAVAFSLPISLTTSISRSTRLRRASCLLHYRP
jgi:tetratricopeptide (TPR) repeat protein